MKLAFIYSGQGAQAQHMARDLYEEYASVKDFYDGIDTKIKEVSFFGDMETLTQTENTQPVMVAFQLAVTDLLRQEGIEPWAVSGLSIGEYSALYAAGVLSREDALDIASFRGKRMAHYSSQIDTSMVAVMGAEEEELRKLIYELDLAEKIFISNINTKGQIVLTGKKEDFQGLSEPLKGRKLRALPLKVSGPFHTPYMAPVADELREFFKGIHFSPPRFRIAMNLTGDYEENNFKELMSRQVMETVRFRDNLERLLEDVDCFIEIGHNRVLAGFLKRLDPGRKVLEIKDLESFKDTVEVING